MVSRIIMYTLVLGLLLYSVPTSGVYASNMRERYMNHHIASGEAGKTPSDPTALEQALAVPLEPQDAATTEPYTATVIPVSIVSPEVQIAIQDVASKLLTVRNNPAAVLSPSLNFTHVQHLHALLSQSAQGMAEADAHQFLLHLSSALQVAVRDEALSSPALAPPLSAMWLLVGVALTLAGMAASTWRCAKRGRVEVADVDGRAGSLSPLSPLSPRPASATALHESAADVAAVPLSEDALDPERSRVRSSIGSFSVSATAAAPSALAAAADSVGSEHHALLERDPEHSATYPITPHKPLPQIELNSNALTPTSSSRALTPASARRRRRHAASAAQEPLPQLWGYARGLLLVLLLCGLAHAYVQTYRVDALRSTEEVYMRAATKPDFCDAAGHARALHLQDYLAHPQWALLSSAQRREACLDHTQALRMHAHGLTHMTLLDPLVRLLLSPVRHVSQALGAAVSVWVGEVGFLMTVCMLAAVVVAVVAGVGCAGLGGGGDGWCCCCARVSYWCARSCGACVGRLCGGGAQRSDRRKRRGSRRGERRRAPYSDGDDEDVEYSHSSDDDSDSDGGERERTRRRDRRRRADGSRGREYMLYPTLHGVPGSPQYGHPMPVPVPGYAYSPYPHALQHMPLAPHTPHAPHAPYTPSSHTSVSAAPSATTPHHLSSEAPGPQSHTGQAMKAAEHPEHSVPTSDHATSPEMDAHVPPEHPHYAQEYSHPVRESRTFSHVSAPPALPTTPSHASYASHTSQPPSAASTSRLPSPPSTPARHAHAHAHARAHADTTPSRAHTPHRSSPRVGRAPHSQPATLRSPARATGDEHDLHFDAVDGFDGAGGAGGAAPAYSSPTASYAIVSAPRSTLTPEQSSPAAPASSPADSHDASVTTPLSPTREFADTPEAPPASNTYTTAGASTAAPAASSNADGGAVEVNATAPPASPCTPTRANAAAAHPALAYARTEPPVQSPHTRDRSPGDASLHGGLTLPSVPSVTAWRPSVSEDAACVAAVGEDAEDAGSVRPAVSVARVSSDTGHEEADAGQEDAGVVVDAPSVHATGSGQSTPHPAQDALDSNDATPSASSTSLSPAASSTSSACSSFVMASSAPSLTSTEHPVVDRYVSDLADCLQDNSYGTHNE